MEHPDEGVIHAWLDGALPDGEASVLESHVAECESCTAAVAEARGFIAASSRIVSALDDVPGAVIPRGQPSSIPSSPSTVTHPVPVARRWWQQRGLAAAALLVVVAGSAVLTMPGGSGGLASRDLAMDNAESAPGRAAASPAPSETRVAMDDANQRAADERMAAAPRAVMSAPAGRPAVATKARATSPVMATETSPAAVADGMAGSSGSGGVAAGRAAPATEPARVELRADARGAPSGGTSATVAESRRASAAARATVIDTNLTRLSVSSTAVTAAKTANAPPAASAPSVTARLRAVAPAPPTLAGCYAVVASPTASLAVQQAMPRRVRLTDSLSGADHMYIARAFEGSPPSARLLWQLNGPDNVLLHVIAAGETTQLRLRMRGDESADGVATRRGC